MSASPELRRRAAFAIALVVALIAVWFYKQRPLSPKLVGSPSASASAAHSQAKSRPFTASRAVVLSSGERRSVEASAIGSFEGLVVSSGTGRGVSGAELTFVGPDGAEAIHSDDDGRFDFHPGREGSYELTLATGTGFLPFAPELGSSPIVLSARRGVGISGMRIALDPTVEYTGHVMDPSGAAVEGAEIKIHDAGHFELALATVRSTFVSDTKGEFKFSAPDGSIVEAKKSGFASGRARVDFAVQVSRHLKVKLGPNAPSEIGAIRGRVVDASGAARSDATVVARIEAENPATDQAVVNPGGRAATDANGEFVLDGLTTGAYTLVASAPESAPAILRGARTGGPPVKLVLTVGSTLRGRVTDATSGEPIVAFTIVVSEREGPMTRRTVRSVSGFDADGRYTVDHLASGAYLVTASAAGYAPSAETDVLIERDATADFALTRGAKLTGVVRDSKTGAPIEGAKVSLEGRLQAGPGSLALLAFALTGPDGRFELGGLGRGERSVLCAAEAHHGRLVGGIVVTGSETIGPIEIELSPTEPGQDPQIELVGIGAVLAAKDDALVIGKIIPGGGAADSGIVIGDAILAIDGVRVTVLGFDTAIQKIRGAEGTSVTLNLRRAAGGEPVNIVVVRKRIKA